jgi:hypothetical protein
MSAEDLERVRFPSVLSRRFSKIFTFESSL